MRFQGKTALVSGAGDGIGLATARIMADEGANVIGVDVKGAVVKAAMDEIDAQASGRAIGKVGDALDAADVARVVAETATEFGRIDILVNCVGGSTIIDSPSAAIESMSLDEWNGLLDFNLTGTFLFLKEVVPVMKRNGGGKIVNLSSVAGRGLSDASSSAYATAKGGIIALTRKLSLELGPHGINCNAIAPGRTLSARIKSRFEQEPEAEKARQLATVPLGRWAEPEDQARVICFLASRDADMVTGVTIDVNGGVR
ncbi:MAG: SDR family oxidoreductase [Chromatiales bacterium]|jgi:NAD(P)-dependent dehydrogenase (short-subunit alcohol dehydrogenase family)|nr:SDR family oxidoreductase [Chromatiales bacterium]